MPWGYYSYGDSYKKKLAGFTNALGFKLGVPDQSQDFWTAYLKACALLRFYFGVTQEQLYQMDAEQWVVSYAQLRYAMEFDAARANSDGKKKIYLPL